MFYYVARSIVWFAMLFVFRIRKIGIENIPKEGGCVFAVNHRSNWDVIMVGITTPRKLTFMAKAELFENKIFGGLIHALGAFPVKRGSGDIGAYKAAMNILRGGNAMLMFPEGHRIKNESVSVKAKTGVAMFPIKAQVPVIPVYISGKYGWMKKITVTYGEPIYFNEYYKQKVDGIQLQELSNSVLETVRGLKSNDRSS